MAACSHVERQMRPLEARCRLGVGKLYLDSGKTRDAGGELTTAVAMLRAMNVSLLLPEAEAALAKAVVAPAGQNA